MSAKERGLGRGLDSLLHASEENGTLSTVDTTNIFPGKKQPRKLFKESSLEELALSIKNQGVIQPLIVRPLRNAPGTYEIIAGERRWRAAQLAGITELPVIITDYSDEEAMAAALAENLQREDLNPMEEAEAMNALKEALHCGQEELAAKLGKSRPAVANALRLLQLPPAIQESTRQGSISAGHARALLGVDPEGLQMMLLDAIEEKHLSVRETESAVEYCKKHGDIPSSLKRPEQAQDRLQKTTRAIKNMQRSLRALCGKKISISGNGTSGHIRIPYDSAEELKKITDFIGGSEEKEKA